MSDPDRGWHERIPHHTPPLCEARCAPIYPTGSFHLVKARNEDGSIAHYHRACAEKLIEEAQR